MEDLQYIYLNPSSLFKPHIEFIFIKYFLEIYITYDYYIIDKLLGDTLFGSLNRNNTLSHQCYKNGTKYENSKTCYIFSTSLTNDDNRLFSRITNSDWLYRNTFFFYVELVVHQINVTPPSTSQKTLAPTQRNFVLRHFNINFEDGNSCNFQRNLFYFQDNANIKAFHINV